MRCRDGYVSDADDAGAADDAMPPACAIGVEDAERMPLDADETAAAPSEPERPFIILVPVMLPHDMLFAPMTRCHMPLHDAAEMAAAKRCASAMSER